MIVEIAQLAGAEAGVARVQTDDSALPLGLENIPVRFEFRRSDHLCVIGDGNPRDAALIDENILAFSIDIEVLSFPPQRGVDNLRQDQLRERIEELVFEKTVKRSWTAHIDISQVFAGAPLGQQTR
jgi:hypothetical protein